jgi:protoheme IX farnesyltransferase
VFVYTMWLKRTTPQNIVIGGAAGAVPALVGWAAVTGSVGLPALVLFAVVFAWTPPHFWALALRHTGDYAAARVPMLPVLRGRRDTALHILLYSILLVGVTLLLVPAGGMGPVYLVAATVLGAVLVGYAVRVWRGGGSRSAMALFRFSITYLGLLFAAVAVDQLVRA